MKRYNMLVPGMCMAAGVSLLLLASACSKKEKVSLQLIAEIDKTTLEADLQSADAQLESSRLEYEYAKKNYERDEALHQKQLISDYDYETSRRDYLVAKSDYERMQANRVSAARNLSYAEITSPMDGIVISREVEIGQTVVSNMEVANLFTIGDLDKMQVVADVDEADIGAVKVGQNAQFTVDAFPDDIFYGQVTQVRISPTTDTNVTTYEVLISTSNPDHKLIPGLTANTLRYYKTDFISRDQTPRNMRALVAASTDLLCIKNDIYKESKLAGRNINSKIARYFEEGDRRMLIIYDERAISAITEILETIESGKEKIKVYVFSPSSYAYDDEFEEVADKVQLCALPDAIYQAYQKVLPKRRPKFLPEAMEKLEQSNDSETGLFMSEA